MGRDVIIACDFNSKEEVVSFLSKFQDEKPFVKIGMELFYAEGPEIVRTIKKMGHKIFLDLKLHDIPNTVKKSIFVSRRRFRPGPLGEMPGKGGGLWPDLWCWKTW